ncbi:tRNA lysidine(34) synthetase TilS [uncultured Ramlibacter sp.]|uniref:tRNA lysidine(34) synthetase TilS n=1 Tax=uncultured Ramlibacter sp. TaxID=260755 RepID=UPI002629C9C6|nr:tRNA lysidine(34) synthetase TilS [uncultured Ramlibacter sp.]
MQGLNPSLPLAVAFSGGADSTALLLAAAQAWPGQVHAIHVHHGLQAAADDFERHCMAVCEQAGVPLHALRVDARHASGESPEDAARRARYRALAGAAQANGLACVLLGQHADDQVETLLLALSRGAGLPGLAAMPARFERHGMRFERPLLGTSGAALRQWLDDAGIACVQDPSNADTSFTRNRIRHQLLPALEQAFPQFRETFARSARHAAQAQELLAALAADDLVAAGAPPAIAVLQALPRSRQANLLRHWLRAQHGAAASAAQLEELLDQVAACTTRGHAIRIKVGAGFVLRQGAALGYAAALPPSV